MDVLGVGNEILMSLSVESALAAARVEGIQTFLSLVCSQTTTVRL